MWIVDVWNFLWPGWDAVWPNILASIICGTVVWLWARRHVHRFHHKLDRIHEHLGVPPPDDKGGEPQ
jgi:hypothetical protein